MGSLNPTIGRIVHVRTAEKFNGTDVHPGIITRVWNADSDAPSGRLGMVNVKVLPDCAEPFDATSIDLYHTQADADGDEANQSAQRCWWPERS